MKTALAFWRGSTAPAVSRSTFQHPSAINWRRISLLFTDFATATRWTVTIDNGDDAPLALERVRLQMLERKLCFEAEANAHYALFYGDPKLTAPHYDCATLFTPQPDASLTAVGPEQANPAYQPRPDERPFTERHPALLWVALIAEPDAFP